MTNRVANFSQYERNISYIMDVQQRLSEGQIQVSSGMKSQDFAGIASDARRLLNVQTSNTMTTQYVSNNKVVGGRLQLMDTNVSQIFDVLTQYKTLLINALNADNASDLALPQQTGAMLDQVTSLLNVQDDGRYLFSGTRTDTPPVDQSKLPTSYTIPTTSGAASGYYQGNSTLLSVRADVNYTVTYGVTADEAPFEEAIRSLHMVKIGAPGDRATLQDALSVVSEALDGISDVRTRIGAAQSAIENVNTKLGDFQLYAQKTISDLEAADPTAIITQMNQDQLALQASYSIVARLANLSLTNFLQQ